MWLGAQAKAGLLGKTGSKRRAKALGKPIAFREFSAQPGQLKEIAQSRRGESDLVHRDGLWFLYAALELPEAALNTEPSGRLGVDLRIVNIATTSDGVVMAGRGLNRHRKRQQELRAKL